MIILFSGIISASALITSVAVKSRDSISAAANRISEITVGEDVCEEDFPEETEEIADTFNFNFFSEGLGWNYYEESSDDSEEEKTAEQLPYPENWNTGNGQVVHMNYGKYSGIQFINLEKGGQVRNLTSVENKLLLSESKMRPQMKIEKSDKPQVLIMHTHTTESYEPYEREFFDSSFGYRTTDSTKNMVMVGDAIAQEIENAGFAVVHDATIHDYPSYNGSYERSAETVKGILEKYPSIQIVLDIHRDAISTGESLVQPVAEIDGKKAAQVMIISGCDDGTMDMPDYMYNFRFASMLQQSMESNYPGLTRPILFDYRKYNQDLTRGSLLIEVGSHGNTLEQARYAGELIGKSLADVLESLK